MANFNNNTSGVDETYDVIVVGGGVVGLSILRSATLKGWKCALVEAESDLLCWASGSNSGIACTGVDASPGTLERALIRESSSGIRGYCKTHNIPNRPCGSLVCRWSWDNQSDSGNATLEDVLEESHDAGDTHATILSADQVKLLEPNLSASCSGAVHIPGEIVVDPWLFSITYAVHARENGARIFTNWKFDATASTFDAERNVWTARRTNNGHSRSTIDTGNDVNPSHFEARAIVNACGVWSDTVQDIIHHQAAGQRSPSKSPLLSQPVAQWTAKPRRGQYRVFRTDKATHIQHPIQPIPTQRTKGIFVFSTLYDQIAVGPTALDQASRTDRSVDPKVSKELATFAKKIIPSLDTEKAYVGDCKLLSYEIMRRIILECEVVYSSFSCTLCSLLTHV